MSKLLKLSFFFALVLVSITLLVAKTNDLAAQQGEPTPTAVSCPESLPPRLAPGSSALVIPGKTAKLHPIASVESEVLITIEPYYSLPVLEGPVCVESSLWWRVNYYNLGHDYTGWLEEGDEETYILQPQPSAHMAFSVSDAQPTVTVEYGGVSFEYNGVLGKTVTAITIHAEKVSPGSGLPDTGEHILFTFEEPGVEPPRPSPTLAIYVVEGLPPINSRVKDQVEIIQALLEQKPLPQDLSRFMFETEPKPQLEIYPPRFEEQWFRTQHKYLTFQNGAGIRFVAMYSRVTPQATNDGLIYSVQAVSDDGKYLVSAVIPIAFKNVAESDILLATMNNLEFELFQQKVQEYAAQIIDKMDQALPADFIPILDDVDALIDSLQFEEIAQ